MKLTDFVLYLLYPPRCAICGECIPQPSVCGAMCAKCLAEWYAEKEKACPMCGRIASVCRCNTVYNKTGIISKYRHCVTYGDEVPKKVLNALKYRKNARLVRFLAGELADLIYESMPVSPSTHIIVYPKRSAAERARVGYDQAKMLAQELSHIISVPVFHGVRHKGGVGQKTLTISERGKNAYNSFSVDEKQSAQLRGRAVILIDDVVTSGATTVSIAAGMKRYGAADVICFSIARTPVK